MATNWSPRYLTLLVFGLSALVVATVGALSSLPAIAVAIVAGILVFAGLASTKQSPMGKNPAKQWLLLAVGVMLVVGGSLGLVQSVQQHWHWTDRLPLVVPLALGGSAIWLVLKFWHKLAPSSRN